jgi:inorganic pyrophosphatase
MLLPLKVIAPTKSQPKAKKIKAIRDLEKIPVKKIEAEMINLN